MSNVYRSWSSEAVVKWNGSIGFQQSAFCRVCIVTFCIAEPVDTSYSVTERSLLRQASSERSTGLKRSRVTCVRRRE